MKRIPIRKILIASAAIIIVVTGGLYAIGIGYFGEHRGAGDVNEAELPPQITAAKKAVERKAERALRAPQDKQILFGDFHVHTTFSIDAFFISLPMLQGLGAHPPADACDFARFCSNLDFWSINDHAEGITPRNWMDTKRSLRQCDAVSGKAGDQDLISFLGWEWTQVGNRPENHYGHKNVVMREIDEARSPARPIASLPPPDSRTGGIRALTTQPVWPLAILALVAPDGRRQDYHDFNRFIKEVGDTKSCPEGVHVRNLPDDCFEGVQTPKELFRKLDEWALDSIVIPHGTTWGFYTPGGSTWDKQLLTHDPNRETLFEIMSGHGNSEEYRDFRAVRYKNGKPYCPKPTKNYLPSCWQAGEIIRKRCLAENTDPLTCGNRAQQARQIYVENGVAGYLTVPGARPGDWLDSGQCKDCLLPAFNYRPGGAAQYVLALTDFSKGRKSRFRFGFLASSDNHNAQPGTGYKEFARHDMSEVVGTGTPGSEIDPEALRREASSKPLPFPQALEGRAGFQALENERQASFFMTGGLVAVHAKSRSRDAIWTALKSREVYGTSGDRILLWFDLLNAPRKGRVTMGGETEMNQTPSFIVRVAGAFEQKPGCPDHVHQALGDEGVERLCLGQCYHPSGQRKKITHIDVIRILPQERQNENIDRLIRDPWRRLTCDDQGEGCVARFSDPTFARLKRDAIYYVRAYQAPTPTVNGDNLRCTYDADGNCVKVNPCFGDYRTKRDDDCLAPKPEVAWSSPIYIDYRHQRR